MKLFSLYKLFLDVLVIICVCKTCADQLRHETRKYHKKIMQIRGTVRKASYVQLDFIR